FSHRPRMSMAARAGQFLSPTLRAAMTADPAEQLVEKLPAAFDSWSGLAQAQYLEMKTLMAGYLLSSQGDRMLMANGVEGRFPFLDHEVVEFANRLDPRLKMRVLNE